MPSIAEAKSFTTSYKFSYIPVAVFVGASQGIGHRTLEALSRITDGKVHIILIARSETNAKRVLNSLVKPLDPVLRDQVLREFIQCDVALMKNVVEAVEKIKQLLLSRIPQNNPPRVNFLFMSAGYASVRFRNRVDTEEGIDRQLALRYYHRFKFTHELLPLLRAARDAGEDSKVLSVLGAGARWPLPKNGDFGYKKWEHGPTWRAVIVSPPYNDLGLEGFAKREPGIAFTHMNPWWVRTDSFLKQLTFSTWPLTVFNPLLRFLLRFVSMPEERSAEYFLYGLLAGKEGFYRRNNYGTDIGLYDHGVDKEQFWKHSMEETRSG
ncbi:hypothetical protein AAF712_006094 [Marasmius tenuissimus]|uniref:NAD(P)-binding protein n=1 Tax=Marasmius tenuissimus TaxID=585030 RepID=A0ABR3A0S5_9AGAR